MDDSLCQSIQQLPRLTVAVLKTKYREVFGEGAKILHKQFLVRRIAWQLQAQAQGDLSERARHRITEIADEADLGPHAPQRFRTSPVPAAVPIRRDSSAGQHDARVPAAGTLLRRPYRGREIVVQVLEQGFEYESRPYRSLSAIAREVTGTRWNGFLFFHLTERRDV
jgi:hypothetical protein